MREFHGWLPCGTEEVPPCLVGRFDCIVSEPQATVTMCHDSADTQYEGPARPGPALPGLVHPSHLLHLNSIFVIQEALKFDYL